MVLRMVCCATAWLWLALNGPAFGQSVDWSEYFPNDPLARPQQRAKGTKPGFSNEPEKVLEPQGGGSQYEPASTRGEIGSQKDNTRVLTRTGKDRTRSRAGGQKDPAVRSKTSQKGRAKTSVNLRGE